MGDFQHYIGGTSLWSEQKCESVEKPHRVGLVLSLAHLAIVDFAVECGAVYGKVRAELERIGQPIGSFDTMIGAHAVRLSLPLVTNNTKEFNRISGLIIEDWSLGS